MRTPDRRLGLLRALVVLGVACSCAGTWLGTPKPALAAWERVLTVDFFSNGDYGSGKGRVTSDDGAIDCSADTGFESGDCSEHYVLPNFQTSYEVTLTMTPATGSYVCLSTTNLCQPGGGAQTFPVHFDLVTPGDQTVTPSFNLRTFQVHLDVDGPGAVTGNGAFCPTGGNADYCGLFKYGQQATLVAHPDAGYPFNFWSGDQCLSEQTTTCSFTVTGNNDLIAYFGRVRLTIRRAGSGTVCLKSIICVEPPGTGIRFNPIKGTTFTLVGQAATGWRFDHWSAGPCGGKPATCVFVLAGETDITGTFVAISTPGPTGNPSTKPVRNRQPRRSASAPAATASAGSSAPATPVAGPGDSSGQSGGPVGASDAPVASPTDATGAGGSPRASATATVDAEGAAGGPGSLLLIVAVLIAAGSVIVGLALGRRRRADGSAGATPPRA